ncbi:Zn(II)2Cys6 transcription factor domain-containing protein [Aspergillus mulundensis]|uniref:Zn(2)-C6 fungal-type domain-containing protein n=1 Tax=Aspergillus mulundensis TaxID=1810919 RepID=A0A3D8RKE9_9EURO|nr:hypothetical protein DSM5745_07191 [Aspergillus mulundensis]RDW74529.1 hypothetical protein DSM5745_07191 [Aspergillus mulundensis]
MNQLKESDLSSDKQPKSVKWGDLPPDKLPKSVKIRQTCNACQQAKIKCSHERPSCKRCQKHNIECVYSISRRLGRPAKKRDPHLESGHNDGGVSKKVRNQKKKKVKEEPMPDFGANDGSVDGEDKPLFDKLPFEHGHIDEMSVEAASLPTPSFMDIVTAPPFSVASDFDMASDSWLHEFMSNPFTDPGQDCGFMDQIDNDGKGDDRMSMDLDSLPVTSEGFSDSTSEALDAPSTSSCYSGVNDCLAHGTSLSSSGQPCFQGNSVYPEQLKQEAFPWSQPLPPLGGDFGEPSGFFTPVGAKRPHDYSFPEEDFKANINGFSSSIFPCQNHEQVVRDLIRLNACAIQSGPTVAIDTILTRQRMLQQLIDTILQCRGCSRIRVDFLMIVILSIDSVITALDTITSAENDVVERFFPDYFGALAQEYRPDAGLATRSRREVRVREAGTKAAPGGLAEDSPTDPCLHAGVSNTVEGPGDDDEGDVSETATDHDEAGHVD